MNWNVFKVKNENHNKAFEMLCYILFCREHSMKSGIFRYKDQVGIETEPIEINGECIGWQAKFFEKDIDKKQIKLSIEKAKKKNPKLNKIFLYTNYEFRESTKKDGKKPEKQKEIEVFAKNSGIEIVWGVPSHIEFQLSLPENKYLADVFFKLGKTTDDSIDALFSHTETLLNNVNTEINFNKNKIKIDNTHHVQNFISLIYTGKTFSVLRGGGGTGKTAIIKELYSRIHKADIEQLTK